MLPLFLVDVRVKPALSLNQKLELLLEAEIYIN